MALASKSLWWAASRSGLSAALAGVAAAVVVVVICWLPTAGVSGHPMSAIKAGLLSFLAAHGGGIKVDGVHADFVPLGMMLVVLVIAWRAGCTLAQAVNERRVTDLRMILKSLGVQTASYVAVCLVLVPISRLGTSSASPGAVLLSSLLVFGFVSGLAVLVRTEQLQQLTDRLPEPVLVGGRAARAVITVYLAAGTLLTLASLVLHAGRVMDLSRQVGGGLSGFPILVAGVFSAPNAVIAGSAYLAGPGFAVGAGTSVNAFSTSHGLLPAFPLLGAVPDGHGANPIVLVLMVLTPVAAGVGAVVLIRREGMLSWRDGGVASLSSAGIAAICLGILAWLGGGAAGAGRLRIVGASAWKTTFAVFLAVLAISLLALLVRLLWDRFAPGESSSGKSDSDDPSAKDLLPSAK